MQAIDPDDLKQAQQIMLEGLVCFDAICQKHQLKYWLDSGTLLGAVRHQGFIPWDDDIDISMPLEDYLKFQEVAADELEDGMFLQTSRTDPTFPFDYMKIRNAQATIVEFHEEGKSVGYHQGVFVDIFPMLAIPNSRFHLWFYRFSFATIRFFSAKQLNLPWVRGLFVKALLKLHKGWEDNKNIVIYGGEMPDVAAAFDMDSVFPLTEGEFEGRQFSVPHSAKAYLEAIYSFNFMELPPEDKRTIHAAAIRIHN